MIKDTLIKLVAADVSLSERKTEEVLNALMGHIKSALRRNETVTLRGLGVFSVKDRPAHIGRNPTTGAAVDVPAKRVVKFKVSQELNKSL